MANLKETVARLQKVAGANTTAMHSQFALYYGVHLRTDGGVAHSCPCVGALPGRGLDPNDWGNAVRPYTYATHSRLVGLSPTSKGAFM